MRMFDLHIDGESSGPFDEAEIRRSLLEYQAANPTDVAFGKVRVIEIPERGHGSAGTERSVFDFIPPPP